MSTRTARTVATIATIALVALTALPQPAEARGWRDRGSYQTDIVDRLEQDGRFTILLTALDTAGLTSTVASAQNITLLAPTDDAFAALLEELEATPADLLGNPALGDILLYHVLPKRYRAFKLLQSNTAETLYDAQPVLALRDNLYDIFVNGNEIIQRDLRARNGLIQVLDGVLLPPEEPVEIRTTIDVLELDGRFSVLLAALDTAGLTGAVESSRLTLLAPTDAAFVELLGQLDATPEELLANPALAEILLYHVLDGRNSTVSLFFRGGATTLQGDRVSTSYNDGTLMINDANVINPNVFTPTGMIQVIDAVLLP